MSDPRDWTMMPRAFRIASARMLGHREHEHSIPVEERLAARRARKEQQERQGR